MDGSPIREIALIGFGEVGGIFGQDFTAAGFCISTFDILFDREPSRATARAKAASAIVRACDSLDGAVAGADLVISAVTASSAVDAARSAAPFLSAGQYYLDINSVSPDTKRKIARIVDETPASFVEAAVMAPVSPQRVKVPMLLGGAAAQTAAPLLQAIGMNVKPVSDRVGVASAIKMCRSIIIKGLEAITVESMLTARRYGAEKQVLESLAATYPGMGWDGGLFDQPGGGAWEEARGRDARGGPDRCGRGSGAADGSGDRAAARLARSGHRRIFASRPGRREFCLAGTGRRNRRSHITARKIICWSKVVAPTFRLAFLGSHQCLSTTADRRY